MTPNKTTLSFLLSILLMTVSQVTLAQPAPVVIKTYGQHIGGNIVYTHLISNNGSRNVVSVAIAEDTDDTGSHTIMVTKDSGELDVLPVGVSMMNDELIPLQTSAPTGWTAEIVQIQDSGRYLQWHYGYPPQPSLQPGQTLRFSVAAPRYDPAYLTGHFSAGYVQQPRYYNGIMEKLDTTPPVLSVTLSPASILPAQRGQMIPVTAMITVKDDYDPAPEIKLVSIQTQGVFKPSDAPGAVIGTDARSFKLNSTPFSATMPRVYVLTFTATDASGNEVRVHVPYQM